MGGMRASMPGFPFSLQSALPGVPSQGLPGMLPPSFLQGLPPTCLPQTLPQPSVTTSSPSLSVGSSPYMCSWMQGRDFCGRRFNSSEELMSHLRTHTASMRLEDFPPSLPPSTTSALALLQAQAAQLRGHVSPPSTMTSSMSPSASDPRYHPYGPPSLAVPPSTMSGSPLPPHLTMTMSN